MIQPRNGTRGPTRGQRAKPGKGGSNLADGARRRVDRPQLTEPASDLPLFEEDGVRFRVLPGGRDDLPASSFDTAAIANTFRAAFVEVWERIQPAVRGRLLAYWNHDRDNLMVLARTPGIGPAPLIQVVHRPDLTCVEISSFGCAITFPASLVVGKPDRLEWEIARALAQVHMLATRTHWRLVLEKLEEPMAAWERESGAGATDEQRQDKLGELERDYLGCHDAEVARIIGAWGVQADGMLTSGRA